MYAKNEILHLESKFDRIEKKYESFLPLISKILDKLESINDEVKVLKSTSSIITLINLNKVLSGIDSNVLTLIKVFYYKYDGFKKNVYICLIWHDKHYIMVSVKTKIR